MSENLVKLLSTGYILKTNITISIQPTQLEEIDSQIRFIVIF